MKLDDHLTAYLTQRRALGFKLKTVEYLLRQFCSWLDARGETSTFTINEAITWAREPVNGAPSWHSQRLTAVRPFAAYLHAQGIDVDFIPKGLLPSPESRPQPFIYSQDDLDRILAACPTFFPHPRVSTTMKTLIALLAATGMRIGEATNLLTSDFDTDEGLLLIRGRKRPLDRLLVLDPTTTEALTSYLASPARLATNPSPVGPVFVNARGTGYVIETIEQHFRALVDHLEIGSDHHRRPRLHDLRHTFATLHMLAAYTNNEDPNRTLSLLTTWLGHTSPEHTYWYLSATPELLTAAASRLTSTTSER